MSALHKSQYGLFYLPQERFQDTIEVQYEKLHGFTRRTMFIAAVINNIVSQMFHNIKCIKCNDG